MAALAGPPRRRLSVTADYITIESLNHPDLCLAIRRRAGEPDAQVARTSAVMTSRAERVLEIDCVFGFFHLLRGAYLAVATSSAAVGRVLGATFFQLKDVQLIRVAAGEDDGLSNEQREDERRYLGMIANVFRTYSFYIAPGYEITNSQQRIASDRLAGAPEYMRADRRFFWNYHTLGPLLERGEECAEWITPVMQGLVHIVPNLETDGRRFDILFFSRRACARVGTRFNCRGTDANGNVANFVETEQVLAHHDGSVTSYVQIRGSIPLYWTQYVYMIYMPKIKFPASDEVSQAAFNKHAADCVQRYGRVTCVNLIDQKTDQLALGRRFAKHAEKLGDDRFRVVWFDFHHECRRMKWFNLSKLVNLVDSDFTEMGYFHRRASGEVSNWQQGVFRTNCVDNLDRTNVVQSIFARRATMVALGLLDKQTDVLNTPYPAFEDRFKEMWTVNANCLGMLYTGTGALKTDFTRTGKRTIVGALDDGWRSVKRYFINNLVDGRVQDQWDLFLGRFTPRSTEEQTALRKAASEETPASFIRKLGLFFFGMTALLATVLPSATASLGMQAPQRWSSRALVGGLVVTGIFAVASFLQLKKGVGFGRSIVSMPHLCPVTDST
mmetsp:Transcript_11327/g.39465  ORF Transcript_11327/g.39465 Transcript_11327/m.39465 type:complete len:612 (-) Transcript_11327:58-1893(-)